MLATLDPPGPADEQLALKGAELFTRYLEEARAPDPALSAPGPGRFLLPGDLAGSPLLTFFPLPPADGAGYAARHARRHAGAPLRELQDACREAVLPRPLRPPRPADRAGRRAVRRQCRRRGPGRPGAHHGGDPRLLPAGRQQRGSPASWRGASTGCCSPPPRPTTCTTPATTGWRPSCACSPTRPSRAPVSPAPR